MRLVLYIFFAGYLLFSSCSHAEYSGKRKVNIAAKKRSSRYKYNSRIRVILDPGHGGKNKGTSSPDRTDKEKDYTLKTALKAKNYLKRMGYNVIMTRSTDEFLSLEKRVNKAKKTRGRIFVSIHYNHAKNKKAKGIEIFYCTSKGKKLASRTLHQMLKKTKSKSRGIKKKKFYVLWETPMPAILIEGGFMSNKSDMAKLKNPQYINSTALGIARGIDYYFHPKSLSQMHAQ